VTSPDSRLGLALNFLSHFTTAEYLDAVREAERRGYRRLWVAEAAGRDAVTTMTLIAAHTDRIEVASGIVPIQTRTPQLLAMTGASLAHLAPGRIALGLGVSSSVIIGQWHGLPFRAPLAQMREAVTLLRQCFSGERVSFEGTHYRARNFRLAVPPPKEPVKILLAALNPGMLELAGELADGVLLNWIAPEAVPASIRHLEAGARRAGRTLGNFEIASFIRTVVTDDVEATRQALARDITGYATVDSYARFFAATGFADETERANTAWKAGDRAGAVKAISPRMLDALGVVGSADFCRARIADFARAGLTEPVVLPFPTGEDPRPTVLSTLRAFGP
jgi:probable F420-dependent oxidoreductase